EVAQIHAGGKGKACVDGDGGKIHGQAARQHDAPLDRLDQLRRIAMAGIVGAAGIGNADDRAIERRVGIARPLDERLAQEQRESVVAVAGQALAQAAGVVIRGKGVLLAHGCRSLARYLKVILPSCHTFCLLIRKQAMSPISSGTRPGLQARCAWCTSDPVYIDYHDTEWGVPTRDPRVLFEMLLLEGFQAGLSWITVLKKRPRYREVMFGFDPEQLAR